MTSLNQALALATPEQRTALRDHAVACLDAVLGNDNVQPLEQVVGEAPGETHVVRVYRDGSGDIVLASVVLQVVDE